MDMLFLFQTESIVLLILNQMTIMVLYQMNILNIMILYQMNILIQIMFPPAKIVPLKKVLVVEIVNGVQEVT